MRFSVFVLSFFAPFVSYFSIAAADEIASTSHVDQVTVFLSGAEVTRIAKVTLSKGEHVIVFKDVPASALPGSIRVDGAATGKLDIVSVDTARKSLSRDESLAADGERKKLEDQLEELRNQKLMAEGEGQASDLQKKLMGSLALSPTRPVNGFVAGAPAAPAADTTDDWQKLMTAIASGTAAATKLRVEADAKVRDINRRINDVNKKLSELAPAARDQTEVRVQVMADSPLDADFSIQYQVANAGWKPLYDARLHTGSKTNAPTLELARRAAITQMSGESWDDVRLELSTTRPSATAAAPKLFPQSVDFEPEIRPVPAPAPMARARPLADSAQEIGGAMGTVAGAAPTASPAAEYRPINTMQAGLATSALDATFEVPGKVSISGNGDAKRVVLMTEAVEPKLSVRTVPKADGNAYLYVTMKIGKGAPLLPGKVYLFRDGTFSGMSDVPLLQPGEEHNLGFGIDDQVKVRFTVLEEKRGESGLISTKNVDSRNFRVSVKNLHDRPIQVTVLDRIPVSHNDEIKVEYTGQTPPTSMAFEDRAGVMAFDMKLEKEEEQQVEYGYRISWPAAKSIVYGP